MIWNVRIEDTVCNRYPNYWQWCFVRCCNRLLYLSCFSYLTFNYSLHFIVHLIVIYSICYVLFVVVLSYIRFHFMIIVYLVFHRIRPFILSCFLWISPFHIPLHTLDTENSTRGHLTIHILGGSGGYPIVE